MRKLHESYNCFVKEHAPKYGKTFVEWYSDNQKFGNFNVLSEISKRTYESQATNTNNFIPSYYSDFFTKKLQLCSNLLATMLNDGSRMKYELGVVADVMDSYEDAIHAICSRTNVGVCCHPSGYYENGCVFETSAHSFKDVAEYIGELGSGSVIVYYFMILGDGSVSSRMWKRELLTRGVLLEKRGR